MHTRNNDSGSGHLFYYLFYFFAATFVGASLFFVVFLSSFRLYSTEAVFLAVAKDNRTTLERSEIVNNVAQIAQTGIFYERLIKSNGKIIDETVGLSKAQKRNFWRDIVDVDVIEDTHIIKLKFRHKEYQQSKLIAGSSVVSLDKIVKAYHNNQIELKLIDDLTTTVTVGSWAKFLSLCLVLSLIISFSIFVLLHHYKIIGLSFRKRRYYSEAASRVALTALKRDTQAVESYIAKGRDNILEESVNLISNEKTGYKLQKIQLPEFNLEEKEVEQKQAKPVVTKNKLIEAKNEILKTGKSGKEVKKDVEKTAEKKFLGREALKAKLREAVQTGKKLENVNLVKKDKPVKTDKNEFKKENKIANKREEPVRVQASKVEEKSVIEKTESLENKKITLRKKPHLPTLTPLKKDGEKMTESKKSLNDEEQKKVEQFGRIGLQHKDWKFGDNLKKVSNPVKSSNRVESKKGVAPSNLPGNLPGGQLPDYMKLSLQPKGNHIQDEFKEETSTITRTLINKSKPTSNLPVGLVGGRGSASKNLPIGSGGSFPYGTREVNEREGKSQSLPEVKLTKEKKSEPSESEYKERLNQLLKGEL